MPQVTAYNVFVLVKDKPGRTWAATFADKDSAYEYGDEMISGDFTDYVVEPTTILAPEV